jgi:hypothetical protein
LLHISNVTGLAQVHPKTGHVFNPLGSAFTRQIRIKINARRMPNS